MAKLSGIVRLGFAFGEYPQPEGGDRDLFESVVAQARAAERAGFDSLWVPDHLMQTPAVAASDDPMLECYTTLGALAVATSRVRLGAFVGCAAYRNAALLAKAVTTLDVISGGRAIFGIGSGWFEAEHEAYGFEFGTVSDRFERLTEVVQIVRSMFTNTRTSFAGRHFNAANALNYPQPLQPAGPPVLIGGSGEKKTLRLVAEYADICNIKGDAATLRHLLNVLDGHCADLNRDPREICRTAIAMVIVRENADLVSAALPPTFRDAPVGRSPVGLVAGRPADVVAQLRELLAAGLDGLILSCPSVDRNPDYVELLGSLAQEAMG